MDRDLRRNVGGLAFERVEQPGHRLDRKTGLELGVLIGDGVDRPRVAPFRLNPDCRRRARSEPDRLPRAKPDLSRDFAHGGLSPRLRAGFHPEGIPSRRRFGKSEGALSVALRNDAAGGLRMQVTITAAALLLARR